MFLVTAAAHDAASRRGGLAARQPVWPLGPTDAACSPIGPGHVCMRTDRRAFLAGTVALALSFTLAVAEKPTRPSVAAGPSSYSNIYADVY